MRFSDLAEVCEESGIDKNSEKCRKLVEEATESCEVFDIDRNSPECREILRNTIKHAKEMEREREEVGRIKRERLEKGLIKLGCGLFHDKNPKEYLAAFHEDPKLEEELVDYYKEEAGKKLHGGVFKYYIPKAKRIYAPREALSVPVSVSPVRGSFFRDFVGDVLRKHLGAGETIKENFEKGRYCGIPPEKAKTLLIADALKEKE